MPPSRGGGGSISPVLHGGAAQAYVSVASGPGTAGPR